MTQDGRPAKEQTRELWEWSGLPCAGYGSAQRFEAQNPPPADLNNLFRYAVPKVIERIQALFRTDEVQAYKLLFRWWYEKLIEMMEHPSSVMTITYPAIALFWVLWRVKEAKE